MLQDIKVSNQRCNSTGYPEPEGITLCDVMCTLIYKVVMDERMDEDVKIVMDEVQNDDAFMEECRNRPCFADNKNKSNMKDLACPLQVDNNRRNGNFDDNEQMLEQHRASMQTVDQLLFNTVNQLFD